MSGGLRVGLLGIGEMGAGLARAWVAAGHEARAVLAGRGAESRARAAEAGVAPAADAAALAGWAEIVFSVLPPAAAEPAAAELAGAARGTGAGFVFVEANAIAPALTRRIAARFEGTGATVVDGGIVGMPPGPEGVPRLYVSGPAAPALARLDGAGFEMRPLGPRIGDASGFKMAYAAVTKGVNALLVNALLAAEAQGFLDAWLAEVEASQPALARRAAATAPALPSDAGRWVREMEEIAASFRDLGLPGGFHDGAAEIMALLAASPFGAETRRTRDRSRDMRATIEGVAAFRRAGGGAG